MNSTHVWASYSPQQYPTVEDVDVLSLPKTTTHFQTVHETMPLIWVTFHLLQK
jgi:hypothetical protein